MKIIFIGTGSGKTSLKRFHSSFLIKLKGYNILIDAGDGIAKALLKQKIDLNSIDVILFTHYHADHFAGIASLITQMKLINRTKQLKIITHKNLVEPLISLINSVYMFKENLNFNLDIISFTFDEELLVDDKFKIIPKQSSHILQKDFLKHYPIELFVSSSFLFQIDNKKIFYSSDIGSKDDLFIFEYSQIEYMIIESTHISTEEIYEAYKKINPKKLFLTHIDDELEKNILKWHKKLSAKDQRKILICFDGMKVQL